MIPSQPTVGNPVVTQVGMQSPTTVGADGTAITSEFGVTGLRRSGGHIQEEYQPQLRGMQGQKVYAEMATHPIIGGVNLALAEVIGKLEWEVVPPENPTPDEVQQAQFVQECLEDMSDGWDVTLSQIMSMTTFGWSYFETVMKYRRGHNADARQSSRFNDGRIGWRKFGIRSQDSLAEWLFDPNGGLRGMVQVDQYTGQGRLTIPIERALLFRTEEYKGNPEGKSLLRSAYRPWFFQKRIQELEAIGIERDFAGMPVIYGPEAWFDANGGKGNANLGMLRDTIQKAKRNEMDGVLLPSIFDEFNNRLLEFKLVTSGGTRQFDTNAVIGRYNNDIATSMLMDWLTLGHEGVGSYSLGAVKVQMWQLVVGSLADGIAAVVNRHAIPRLMLLNGWTPDRMPELTHSEVTKADLAILGTFLGTMVDHGLIVPDEQLENFIRTTAGLPETKDLSMDAVVPTTSLSTDDETPAPAPEQQAINPDAPPTPEVAGAPAA